MEKAPLKGVRFAPSPTGRFHVGNLRTAWVSRQWARRLREPWVLRFEDIDAPRVVPGAREQQLEDLLALGLEPDQVLVQSDFRERHWETFRRAVLERRVYPCFCSRKDVREALEQAASAPHPGLSAPSQGVTAAPAVYSGRCRSAGVCAQSPPDAGLASLGWRFALEENPSGRQDFIVARSAPGLDAQGLPPEASFAPAYHWACAVDDWDGAYRLLVRAADLAEVVSQHRAVMAWLARSEGRAFRFPAVFHTALVTGDSGERLEKRTRGVTLPELRARGIDPPELVARFAASFGRFPELEEGGVFGEAERALTLSALGLR